MTYYRDTAQDAELRKFYSQPVLTGLYSHGDGTIADRRPVEFRFTTNDGLYEAVIPQAQLFAILQPHLTFTPVRQSWMEPQS